MTSENDEGAPSPPPPPTTEAAGGAPVDRVLLRFARKPSKDGGAREEVRIAVRFYEGHPYIDVRHWFEAKPEWKPTPRGITIRARELPLVAAALAALVTELAPQNGATS